MSSIHSRAQIIKELVDDLMKEVNKAPSLPRHANLAARDQSQQALEEMIDAQTKLAATIQLYHAKTR